MSVTYRIAPEEGMVYLTTVGEARFDELKAVMLCVLADPSYRAGFNFISDRTQETDLPDSAYVRRCIDFLREHSGEMGRYRWAMVSRRPAIYGMQRMFSILAEQWGIRAVAFQDLEEARRWLLAA